MAQFPKIDRIVSGGQTGADRAGLDVAIKLSIPHGGWCPKGRKAVDAVIPARYNLIETPSANYFQRTEWNVRDSDATVIFTVAPDLTGGSKRTAEFAVKHGKPFVHVHAGTPEPERNLAAFLNQHVVKCLNVAGSREDDERPGIYAFTQGFLMRLLGGD